MTANYYKLKIATGDRSTKWIWATDKRQTGATLVYRIVRPDGDFGDRDFFIGTAGDVLVEKPAFYDGRTERFRLES